jgi:hypothetical protein
MTISKINRVEYLVAPSFEEIEEYRKLMGVNVYTFERYFGIARASYGKYKQGTEKLPARLWGIVYKKILPVKTQKGCFLPTNKNENVLACKKSGKERQKHTPNAIISKLAELKQDK